MTWKETAAMCVVMTLVCVMVSALLVLAAWKLPDSKFYWGFFRYNLGLWILAFLSCGAFKAYQRFKSKRGAA
ncbi:hypothetical protein [Hafnia paralvei]|uniref:hypothetical protein n=1 Tax=Hafnia paralvei TaxID=546367 RepID=UPI00267350F3|nr:hypothetical protein [Hafnia paralvei]